MSLQYIIDGYNILNHPVFTQRSNKKIQDKRAALISLIKTNRLTGSQKNKITVVFDGYPGPQDAHSLIDNNEEVDVVFSRKESADEKIKRIVESYANRKNIVVVSDDKQIQFIVKSLNATAVGVEAFIARGEKPKRDRDNEQDMKLTYTQMHHINEELRKLWLK